MPDNITNSAENIQNAVSVYTAIRGATLEAGWELFVQVIKSATDQAFVAGRDAAIDYLQAEDYNIPRVAYVAMGNLTPDGKL